MQASVRGDVNLAADKLFDFATEADESEARLSWHVLHQEVKIAVRARFVSSEGTEDADVSDAIAFAKATHLGGQALGKDRRK